MLIIDEARKIPRAVFATLTLSHAGDAFAAETLRVWNVLHEAHRQSPFLKFKEIPDMAPNIGILGMLYAPPPTPRVPRRRIKTPSAERRAKVKAARKQRKGQRRG